MRDRSLVVLCLIGLVGWLVSCLVKQNREMTDSIAKATSTISQASKDQMGLMTRTYSTTFSETTKRVTDLAEVLLMGRDSPIPSESSQTDLSESESESGLPLDTNDLPETARWAMEEEAGLQQTEMPWQSSKPLDVLD